jgi:hypothetical protein
VILVGHPWKTQEGILIIFVVLSEVIRKTFAEFHRTHFDEWQTRWKFHFSNEEVCGNMKIDIEVNDFIFNISSF